jgi:hypothetical protein
LGEVSLNKTYLPPDNNLRYLLTSKYQVKTTTGAYTAVPHTLKTSIGWIVRAYMGFPKLCFEMRWVVQELLARSPKISEERRKSLNFPCSCSDFKEVAERFGTVTAVVYGTTYTQKLKKVIAMRNLIFSGKFGELM